MRVHSYSVMSNHLHVVVRTLPQQVLGWSDEEVARRWLCLFPGRGGKPGEGDNWLAPLGLAGTSDGCHQSSAGGMAQGSATDAVVPPPLLPNLSLERYLELLDWTGRQVRLGKRGFLSAHLRPALARLDLDVEAWVENVERFGGLFCRVAGKLRRLRERAQAIGQASVHGHAGARRLYARAG